ncbi:SseB family protein [Streptomyces sp. NBC_01794]|nr:SseB family protein [Streptomyces sp. NBC_01794]
MRDNGDDTTRPKRALRLSQLAGGPAPGKALALQEVGQLEACSAAADLTPTASSTTSDGQLDAVRRRFAVVLGEFRRTAVLVPHDPYGSLWTADQGGVRWICAFSDEEALARFARAQGDAEREWTYQTILGARLLDVMVPMVPGPAGVALDAGSDEGMLFPPVRGIVPEAAAVDLGGME